MSVQVLIVVGPQGCGKSQLAMKLAKLYQLENVVDGWDGCSPCTRDLVTVPGGCLVLTNVDEPVLCPDGVKMLSFDSAKALVETVARVA